MIDKQSALVGSNLSQVLLDKNIDLTPIHGSLVSELSQAVAKALSGQIESMDAIEYTIVQASEGSYNTNRLGQKSYAASAHDILMDNYVPELSALITNHIAFARSVVYKKMALFVEAIEKYDGGLKVRQAEDFFRVNFYKLHDFFQSQFLMDELEVNTPLRTSPELINFGDTIDADYDLLGALLIGESGTDEMLKTWFAQEGKDKLLGYIRNDIKEWNLSLQERLNYHLINFLFYRNLVLKQETVNGMSLLQLVSKGSVSRDYHIGQLRINLKVFEAKLKAGDIIAPESDVKFSHVGDQEFDITLFAENFDKAADQGGTIDAVYGYIAKYGKTDLTVAALVAQKEELETAWRNVRSLYASHLLKNKDYKRIELKRVFLELLNSDETEDEQAFYAANAGFKEATVQQANAYIDGLSVKELDDTIQIAFNLFAKITYRYTSAWKIIGDMLEIHSVNPEIEMQEAAQAAAVNYIVDFLMAQCSVSKR